MTYRGMKRFKDWMYSYHRIIHRVTVQTYNSEYDSYEGRLNEACRNLISFYNVNFCKKQLFLPRLPAQELDYQLIVGLRNSALPVMKHYRYAWKSTRSGGELRSERSAGDYMYANAYGYLDRMIGEINCLCEYDYKFEGVIIYE